MGKASKRVLSSEPGARRQLSEKKDAIEKSEPKDEMEFEDDFEDTFEEEEIVDCENEEADINIEGHEVEDKMKLVTKIYRHGQDAIGEDEELVCEPGTYDMLHKANTEWPCMTFDIIGDSKGMKTKFPLTAYVVAGTQADESHKNRIYVMKWSRLHKTKNDDMDEPESDAEDDDAVLDFRMIPHDGTVNRIRAMPQMPHIVASWSDKGLVHIWDLSKHFAQLDGPAHTDSKPRPIFSHSEHPTEGYAMAWDPHVTGRFATGCCAGEVHVWSPVDGGWEVDRLGCDSDSIEDIAFKIKGNGAGKILATAGVSGSIKIWDLEERQCTKSIENAHDCDINVIAWNPIIGDMLLTGDDKGCFKVWNPRVSDKPLAMFHWHQQAITAVSWHPTDESMMAVASEDHSISVWDMSVENDHEEEVPEGADYYPPQLLFLHQGQKDIKEVMWHPQMPSVAISSGGDGFNIFKACNL